MENNECSQENSDVLTFCEEEDGDSDGGILISFSSHFPEQNKKGRERKWNRKKRRRD